MLIKGNTKWLSASSITTRWLALLIILCSYSNQWFSIFLLWFLYINCEISIFMDHSKFHLINTTNFSYETPYEADILYLFQKFLFICWLHPKLQITNFLDNKNRVQFYLHNCSTTKALTDKMCHFVSCQPTMCHRESFQCSCRYSDTA